VKFLRYLLIFVPLAIFAEFVLHKPLLVFAFCCVGLIPLAGLLGEATEELAIHAGPKIGGLLNATLGNAAELIITIVALSTGKWFQPADCAICRTIAGVYQLAVWPGDDTVLSFI
jgi:Ca2+:H+ antiporter